MIGAVDRQRSAKIDTLTFFYRSDDAQSPWENEDERTKFMSQLSRVLKLDLARLWALPKPDEMFLGLFAKVSFTLLENPSNHKSKHIKECIFAVLRLLVARYQQTTEAVNLLIGLVKKQDAFVNLMIDLTVAIVSGGTENNHDDDEDEDGSDADADKRKKDEENRGPGAAFLSDVLVEISNLSYRELSTNNNAAKGFATFVSSVASHFPKQTLPFMSQLMTHLSGESANMRSGIIEALGYIIHKAFRTESAEEVERIRANLHMRDQLLDILLQRFRDTTSYTRGRVLQTWAYLAENKAITKSFWQQVTTEAVGRLQDKAAHVRKCAIQLLQSLLLFNPFGSELRLTQFRKTCDEARQIVDQRSEGRVDRLVEVLESGDEAALAELNVAADTIKLGTCQLIPFPLTHQLTNLVDAVSFLPILQPMRT
jgi:condensin complex subunit 1